MHGIARDLRSALRQLRAAPGLSAAVILALGLGIGANTALFAIVEALELRPLPLGDPGRVVAVGIRPRTRADQLPGPLSVPDSRELARSAPALASLAVWRRETFGWARQGESRKVNVLLVSEGLFRTLGLPLQMGRELEPGEVGPSPAHVAVVSDRFWRAELGGTASVLGTTLTLDGDPYEIVGVAAPRADFPLSETPADVVLPLGVTPFTKANMQHQGAQIVRAVGRLAPGATLAEARAEVRAAFDRIVETHPSSATETADVVPFRRAVLGGTDDLPLLLLAATGFVLLIACVNVANLLLARALRRRRELAVRAALGASRGDLRRQLLVESTLLAVLAAVAAVMLSTLVLAGTVPLGPRAGSVIASYRVDAAVVLFAAALALGCGLACGAVAGAFALPREVGASLQASASGDTGRGHERVRSSLVVLEVALSAVLLVGAGLLGRTLYQLTSVDPGMRIQGLLGQELSVPDSTSDPELRRLLASELERVSAVPGVEAAGAIRPSFYEGRAMTTGARTSDLGDLWPETVDFRLVAPGTFQVLGIPLVAGRDLDPADIEGRPEVVVVNQSLARRLWPGQDPIGQHLALGLQDHALRTVVGVVGDVRQSLDAPARPEVYVPMGQVIDSKHTIVVRARAVDPSLISGLTTSLQGIHPGMLVSTPVPFSVRVQDALLERRLAAAASLGFAAVALFLAALGIGGVLSQLVSQRTRELGIRMALGARAADVARLVLGRGLLLAATGLVLGGAAAALGLGPSLRRFLYGVGTVDPWSYVGAMGALLAVAAAASWLPARRASHVDPAEVMRAE